MGSTRKEFLKRSSIRKRKPRPRAGDCPEYLAFVRLCPCFVCYAPWWVWFLEQPKNVQDGLPHEPAVVAWEYSEYAHRRVQATPTEAAHIGRSTTRRGLGQKVPDSEAGPLCADHHRLLKNSHHAGTKTFWEKHPTLDRDGLQIG